MADDLPANVPDVPSAVGASAESLETNGAHGAVTLVPPAPKRSEAPPAPVPQPPGRGRLHYEVSMSSTQVEAGRPFSLWVKVTNPYDVPVTIDRIETPLPVQFVNLVTASARSDRGQATHWWQHLVPKSVRFSAMDIGVEFALATVSTPRVNQPAQVPGTAEADSQVAGGANDPGTVPTSEAVHLESGDSIIQTFSLRTSGSPFGFTPSTYQLNLLVCYIVQGIVHHDTEPYQVTVRAPLQVLAIAAGLGAVTGLFLRNGGRLVLPSSSSDLMLGFLEVLSYLILGVVGTIAFARKRDAQPFVSIEDFWGGIFFGMVVGFAGPTFLQGLLTVGQSGDVGTLVPTATAIASPVH